MTFDELKLSPEDLESCLEEVFYWRQVAERVCERANRILKEKLDAGKKAREMQTQCWTCPNCHDDHSSSKPCPEFIKLKEDLERAPEVFLAACPETLGMGVALIGVKHREGDTHKARLVCVEEIKK